MALICYAREGIVTRAQRPPASTKMTAMRKQRQQEQRNRQTRNRPQVATTARKRREFRPACAQHQLRRPRPRAAHHNGPPMRGRGRNRPPTVTNTSKLLHVCDDSDADRDKEVGIRGILDQWIASLLGRCQRATRCGHGKATLAICRGPLGSCFLVATGTWRAKQQHVVVCSNLLCCISSLGLVSVPACCYIVQCIVRE